MDGHATLGLASLALVVLFPFGLLSAVWLLDALERWMVTPSERAAEVVRLLADEDPETIEDAVADLLAQNADRPGEPVRTATVKLRAVTKLPRAGRARVGGHGVAPVERVD